MVSVPSVWKGDSTIYQDAKTPHEKAANVFVDYGIKQDKDGHWVDDKGNVLKDDTGKPLTDQEVYAKLKEAHPDIEKIPEFDEQQQQQQQRDNTKLKPSPIQN
jgi:hypothetical protein